MVKLHSYLWKSGLKKHFCKVFPAIFWHYFMRKEIYGQNRLLETALRWWNRDTGYFWGNGNRYKWYSHIYIFVFNVTLKVGKKLDHTTWKGFVSGYLILADTAALLLLRTNQYAFRHHTFTFNRVADPDLDPAGSERFGQIRIHNVQKWGSLSGLNIDIRN